MIKGKLTEHALLDPRADALGDGYTPSHENYQRGLREAPVKGSKMGAEGDEGNEWLLKARERIFGGKLTRTEEENTIMRLGDLSQIGRVYARPPMSEAQTKSCLLRISQRLGQTGVVHDAPICIDRALKRERPRAR